jgi:uncharacterized protein (DUF697 family)
MEMPLGIINSLRSAYASLNPEQVRNLAQRPVTIELVADTAESYADMEAFFIPAITSSEDRATGLLRLHRAANPDHPESADITVYEEGVPCPKDAFTFHREHPEQTIEEILDARSDLEIPLARNFLAFRGPAVHHIINRVARENALFTVVTAMPNIIPTLLEIPWALGEYATDSAFLTVNQVRMAFLIAAASGRPVGLSEQKAAICAIVASAFGWRAIARELVGKIPLGGGLIPKAAIAWAGTFVVGRGVEQMYLTGDRIRRNEHKELYEKALVRGKEVASSILHSVRKPSAA